MAAITPYTRKDGTKLYQLQAYLGTDESTGKRIRVFRRGFETEREAQLEFARLLLERSKGGEQKQQKIRFEQVYLEWLDQYRVTVKESTLRKTKEYFKLHILPAIGNKFIDKITLHDIQKAVNEWALIHSKVSIIKNYVSSVFKYALPLGYVEKNPCELVKIPKKTKVESDKANNFYSLEELQAFLHAIGQEPSTRWHTFYHLLAFTGMRRGEALALTWDHIDFKNKVIRIRQTVALGLENKLIILPPKNHTSNRDISIDDSTVAILKKWRKEQIRDWGGLGFRTMSKEQLVFSNMKDNDLICQSEPGHVLDRVCKKHKLRRITPHGFRHTHCSLLFEAGASIKEVQDRLGHSDIQTTMNIYAHVSQKKKDETATRFAEYVAL